MISWREHARAARQLHEKLFYRPLLEAVARLPGEDVRLTPQAAQARLEALGYSDPEGALRHIAALTAGVSRKTAIQRTLLPVLLGWFADAAQPDAGLLAFRQVSEALGQSPWYLRLLRDDTRVAQRMARILASSRYAAGLLLRSPDAVAMLGDDPQLAPRSATELRAEAAAAIRRHADADDAVRAALALRRRELFRTAAADLLGLLDIEQTAAALSTVAAVTVGAALEVAIRTAEQDTGPLPTRIAVLALGRLGGQEMSYSSDADVMFVHDPRPGADEESATRAAHAVAEELRGLLGLPGRTRPCRSTRTCGPKGGRGRWSARWPPTRLTTGAGPAPGKRRRCCAPNPSRATRSWAAHSSPSPTSCATRRGACRTRRSGKYAGSRPGWKPNASPGASTRRCS